MKTNYFFLIFMFCSMVGYAQNNDFNNGGGDLLWSNTANWSLGFIPTTANTGQVRLISSTESLVNQNFTIKKIQNTFGTLVNTPLGGNSILTIDPGVNNGFGFDNVSNSDVNMIFNGNVTINNTASGTPQTLMRNSNGNTNDVNSIVFGDGSTLTLTTNLELRTGTGGDSFNFNGTLAGSAGLRISAGTTAIFGSTANNTGFSGDIVYIGAGAITVNSNDNNVFLPSGRKLQINSTGGSIAVNGANVFDGNITVGGTNTFDVDMNKNQDNMGSIILSASGTLNLDVDASVTELAFADNSASAWNTGTISITGFKNGVIRFGTDNTGLTTAQLSQINIVEGVNGLALDNNGYLYAYDTNWTGTTDSDWSTAGNWSHGVPFSSSQTVFISDVANAPIISGTTNASIGDLVINETDGLTINSGGSLIVNGGSTGNVTYTRTLATTNWYLASSPVSGEIMTDMRANNSFENGTGGSRIGFAPYNTSDDSWSYFTTTSTDALANGTGYSAKLASTGNLSFTGTINTGDVTATVASAGNGFNLVGNPYTSHINSKTFLDANANLDQTQFWVWNQAAGASGMYEVKTNGSSTILAPTQGFFVKVNSGTQVSFAASNQVATGGVFQKTSITELKLLMSDGKSNRFAKIHFSENTTKGFDYGWEGETFGGIPNSLDVFTHLVEDNQGKKYQVQSLPLSELSSVVIPLGIIADAGKELSFSLETANFPSDVNVYLEDRLNNSFNEISNGKTFKITLDEKSNDVGRFYVHSSKTALSVENNIFENVSIYKTNNATLRIAGLAQGTATVKVFNILGKQVLNNSFVSNGVKEIQLPRLTTGVYIVQLQTANGKLNKKIILE